MVMYRSRQCIVAIAIVLGVAGCSHSPQWTHTFSSSELYYQGVGDGRSEGQAKRSAELGLCGEMQQRTISIQSIHEAQERVTNGTFQNESTFRQWIKEEFDCELPAGVRIAERARIDSRYWAYAIAERPGQEQRINQLFARRTSGMKMRAMFPGWAQFRSGERDKAWSILLTEGVAVVGFGASAIASSDYRDRRDRARHANDYEYYDDWANRLYWSSVGFGVVAVGTYLFSLIDGISSTPMPHKVLLSRSATPTRDGLLTLRLSYTLP